MTVIASGMTVYGGAGNDTLNTWAAATMFGEAGQQPYYG